MKTIYTANMHIPYADKFLRDFIFANFANQWAFAKMKGQPPFAKLKLQKLLGAVHSRKIVHIR